MKLYTEKMVFNSWNDELTFLSEQFDDSVKKLSDLANQLKRMGGIPEITNELSMSSIKLIDTILLSICFTWSWCCPCLLNPIL